MKLPELLAPAGNFEKLRAALLYGADAVYLAGRSFGMRSAADNFTVEELFEAARYKTRNTWPPPRYRVLPECIRTGFPGVSFLPSTQEP